MIQSFSWMKRSLIVLPVAFTFAKNVTCECCHRESQGAEPGVFDDLERGGAYVQRCV